jgi:hypothetical protein
VQLACLLAQQASSEAEAQRERERESLVLFSRSVLLLLLLLLLLLVCRGMYVSLYFHSKGFGEEAAGKPTVSSLHFLGWSPLPGRSFVLVQEEDDQLSLSLQNRILLALFVEWPFVTWS